MSDESSTQMAKFVYDHPRMMGALFTLLLLLTQAGSVAAGATSTYVGP